MKPVRLSATATIALPRWGLIALCLLYILPGIVRRDPWKMDDAAGFGIMWTMAHGTLSDWLLPNIVGLPMPSEAPLAYWIGALLIRAFGWLTGDALAARLSILVFFAIGALAVWRTAFVLGRRAEAQPLKLAFGGQPAALDYGRTLADGALLIYVASLGLLLRSHETASPALQVSLVALAMYGAASLFDRPNKRSVLGLGICIGLLYLASGWIAPLLLMTALIVVSVVRYRTILPRLAIVALIASIPLVILLLARQKLGTAGAVDTWVVEISRLISSPTVSSTSKLLKTLLWFTWPAWPIALWAVYAWRAQVTLHILLPAVIVLIFIVAALFGTGTKDYFLLPLLPPLAILATFGLPTLKRGAINAIDWFAVTTLSSIAAFIWLGWVAKQTGWPASLARNALRQVPNFQPEFNVIAVIIALMTTVGWLLLLRWRLGRHPGVLWRAVVLSTGGIVLCWVLLMTLWLPWLNYRQSYVLVTQQLVAKLPDSYRCVDTDDLGPAQRASFAYFGNIKFGQQGSASCEFLLVQDSGVGLKGNTIKQVGPNLSLLWQGRREADKRELFRLFRRDAP